ncbi:hypothetical protein DFH94DRAFT_403677 [Russula ochroleuca]|uniref:Uncharacterized protein n=1 Tax=Russula ochroleuca TaxID=152965 RepID=A0A9P5MYB0_9AGAM|nr:hypothetical protein DFH94DRAFT_403677 [Russula ochroleuca]
MTSPPVLPNGLYTISKEQRELATLQSVKPGTDVVLQPSNPDEFPDQRWEVRRTPKGTYTIINRGNSLSFEGEPEIDKLVRGYPDRPPREWSLYKAAERNAYYVVVPGGPVDGRELAFDESALLIVPPRTWLTHLDVEDQKQAWVFTLILF